MPRDSRSKGKPPLGASFSLPGDNFLSPPIFSIVILFPSPLPLSPGDKLVLLFVDEFPTFI